MSTSNSTRPQKPAKPNPAFPLFPHATGRWCKKILGKLHYFGPWDDPDAALQRYLDQKDALHAGLTPADTRDRLTVFLLCAKFLTSKKREMADGEISSRTFAEYAALGKRLLKVLGKDRLVVDLRPDDFGKLRRVMARTWGPVRLKAEIVRTRVPFNWAYKNGLIDRPMVFGEMFKAPKKKTLRQHRAAQGPKMFEAEEVRRMLDAAGQPLKTMILLGVNCGFGNSDLATLPLTALDLEHGWINYPRPKTGIARRGPLWTETAAALREWLTMRPKPTNDGDGNKVFITRWGASWEKDFAAVTKETRKLLNRLGISGHRNFYALRHTFQTIADDARDFVATRSIMGHASNDIADDYREKVNDDRLRAVAEHVRGWLFGQAKASTTGQNQKVTKPRAKKENPGLRLFSA